MEQQQQLDIRSKRRNERERTKAFSRAMDSSKEIVSERITCGGRRMTFSGQAAN